MKGLFVKWDHDALMVDLAEHLRANSKRITWCDMQLGEAGSPRPDVYTMEPTYTRLSFEAFEIKISVSDFRSDTTSGKWQKYLRYANSVTFAAPQGLVRKEDVPGTCGLIVRGEAGWRYAKKPTPSPLQELPWRAWVKLLLDGTERAETSNKARIFSEWRARQKLAKKFGEEAARMIYEIHNLPGRLELGMAEIERQLERQRDSLKQQQERWQAERDAARERCSRSLSQLAVALGLPHDATVVDLDARANRVLQALGAGEARWRGNRLKNTAETLKRMAEDLDAAAEALGADLPSVEAT